MPEPIPARWPSRPTASALFVADASLNAVAVFDTATLHKTRDLFPCRRRPSGFIPTDWYPSALAAHGDDLLIATAKGESTGPNNGISQLKSESRHREHPYIPTLMYGSLSRLNFRSAEKHLPELTQRVKESNLFHLRSRQDHFHERLKSDSPCDLHPERKSHLRSGPRRSESWRSENRQWRSRR